MNAERESSAADSVLPKPYLDADWDLPEPPLLTIVFPKYRGRSYPQAVLTAQQADIYKEHVASDTVFHVAAFARTGPKAATALVLLNLTRGIKGTMIFGSDGALIQNAYAATLVLECFQKASLVDDHTAYCYTIIDDPFVDRSGWGLNFASDLIKDRYVLPCRLINRSYLEFDSNHPSRPEDLMQAAAVRQGSNWCPHFSARAFQKVDSEFHDRSGRQEVKGRIFPMDSEGGPLDP